MPRLQQAALAALLCVVVYEGPVLCQAVGTRGASHTDHKHQRVLENEDISMVRCSEDHEITSEIVCHDCDLNERRGTCQSLLWMYHGGPCSVADTAATVSRTSANVNGSTSESDISHVTTCIDIGEPPEPEDPVFVVVTDTHDDTKQNGTWVIVGDYFAVGSHNLDIGQGLSNVQNITFYSTNVTLSSDTMIQTMLFYAPCSMEGVQQTDPSESVTLLATSEDPTIRANLEWNIKSLSPTAEWHLTKATMATNTAPYFLELNLTAFDGVLTFTKHQTLVVPFQWDFNRFDQLNVLGTVRATAIAGTMEGACHSTSTYLYQSMVPNTLPPIFPSPDTASDAVNETGIP